MTRDAGFGLAAWLDAFEAIDSCPWPGPRPLGLGDPSAWLVGRVDDARRFRLMVEQHRLVILDGDSGVGKTSLLHASLIPELAGAGFAVAAVTDWTDDTTSETVPFLAEKVRQAFITASKRPAPEGAGASLRQRLQEHAAEVTRLPGGAEFFVGLGRLRGPESVIILDQFEELIRYSDRRAERVISTLVALNHHFDVKVVVSLRSEYLHRLRRLEREAKPFSLATLQLNPVADEHVREVIEAGNHAGQVISEEAVRRVEALWVAARQDAGHSDGSPEAVTLLHLQAFLYALHDSTDGSLVGTDDFTEFVRRLVGDGNGAAPAKNPDREALGAALAAAVEVKLDRCTKACGLGMDPYLVEGSRQIAARATPHLSSGGFKLHRELDELLRWSLTDEMNTLRAGTMRHVEVSAKKVEEVRKDLVGVLIAASVAEMDARTGRGRHVSFPALDVPDLVSDPWWALVDRPAVRSAVPQLADWLRTAGEAFTSTEATATCGPMMGLSPVAGLVEECRRYAFAITWMRASALVRLSSPEPGKWFVQLIHDRFGRGLESWADRVAEDAAGALRAITSPNGAWFDWRFDRRVAADTNDAERPDSVRALPNIRWRGAWICAPFRNMVFVNGDFRGTMFQGCTFEGVTFVNCLLDGAIFSDCAVRGRPPEETLDWNAEPLRFGIPVEAADVDTLRSMAVYRRRDTTDDRLFSPLAGLPAVPWSLRDEIDPVADAHLLNPGGGGLRIVGGRLSTLVFRNTLFEGAGDQEGLLSFRHVAGSGLEIVEQVDPCSLEIHGSALRHVSVTSTPDPRQRRTDADPGHVALRIAKSAITQLWFGQQLHGDVKVSDCRLVQVWNSSPGLAVTVDDSRFHGLVGCLVGSASPMGLPVDGPSADNRTLDEADPDAEFRERARAMDYVRDPTQGHAPNLPHHGGHPG